MDKNETVVLCDAVECKFSDGAVFLVGSQVFICPKKVVNVFMSSTGVAKCISYAKEEAESAGDEQ